MSTEKVSIEILGEILPRDKTGKWLNIRVTVSLEDLFKILSKYEEELV